MRFLIRAEGPLRTGEETFDAPLQAGAAPPYQPTQEKGPPDAQGSGSKEDRAGNERRIKG